MQARIQKILSARGVGSRRYCEQLIEAGRVSLDGEPVTLGMSAPEDTTLLALDGVAVEAAAPPTYIMLHKPRGFVTTAKDEQGRKTVLDLVQDCPHRVFPVGRLDMYSEGLLLLTNDGELANRLMHPRYEHEKEYLAWVQGDVAPAIEQLSKPQVIDGMKMSGARVQIRGEGLLSMTIREGKNRQIRRMCSAAGLSVTRLKRIGFGTLRLGDLPSGKWRMLTDEEITELKK